MEAPFAQNFETCESQSIALGNGENKGPGPKKKRNRRKERMRNNRQVEQDLSIECIAEDIESLSIAADTSANAIRDTMQTGNEAECSVKKKKRTRNKKTGHSTSLKIDSCNETIPEMLYLKPSTKSLEESEQLFQISSCSVQPKSQKQKGIRNGGKPAFQLLDKHGGGVLNHQEVYDINQGAQRNQKFKRRTHNPATENKHCSDFLFDKKEKRVIHSRKSPVDTQMDENSFEDHLQRELVEVMLKEQNFVVKGFLRINQRNFREAYIHDPDGGKDILISGVKNRNRGLEGDEVAVQILPQSAWITSEERVQKTGKVIHILSLVHQRQAIGTLKKMSDNNSRNVLFSPRDSRIPRMRVPLKECPKDVRAWENNLFCARITNWTDTRFAKGQIVGESVGIQGDIKAETLAILLENEIEFQPYDKQLYKYFPKPPYLIKEEDLVGREDLRNICIFTIDPQTARDLDDAVSCELLQNGNYKVGVHISDVSQFLKEGTPLDVEVSKRATTTYLVHEVYHMLPRELTMMCSLLPGEDKLAFSVFWEITPDAVVLSHYFTRSVINSCVQLSYEHAQLMIDDPGHEWKDGELPPVHGTWCVNDLKNVVAILHKLALIMRKRRFDGGALRVDQTKLLFHLDESGLPASVFAYVNKESHRLIEEFMLLANMTVATALQEKFPKIAFLRCHDEPQPDMMERLAETLEKFGIVIDVTSAGALHKSLQRHSDNDALFIALSALCSKPMTRARYFAAGNIEDVRYMRHYALNAPLYTHFTSPIRRYADVMVHRLLSGLLGYSEEPKWIMDYVNTIASKCNKQKYCAKKAGEQSSELFYALWVGKCVSIQENAVVIDVKDHSFDAVVCSTGFTVRVYTDKLPGEVEFMSTPLPRLRIIWTVVGESSQPKVQVISMFNVVTIILRKSVTNFLKVEASLLPPSI